MQMRAALYIRVSSEEQAIHGLSIEAQTEALEKWAGQEHVYVVDRYIDAGMKESVSPSCASAAAGRCAGG